MTKPVILVLGFFLVGCSSPSDNSPIDDVSFETCGGTTISVKVTADRVPIGPSSNAIRRFDDDAFIVESGSNTLSKLAVSGVTEFADAGNDQNPWDVFADDDEVWVTNFLGNTISVFDRSTGSLVQEISDPAFQNPSGILKVGDRVFVSQVAFGTPDYGPGSVVEIDASTKTVSRTFPTADLNPQFLSRVDVDGETFLAVVNSGEFDVSTAGAFAKTDGSLELWQIEEGAVGAQEVYPLPLVSDRRIGSPSEPHQIGETLYLASGTGPVLFKFDLKTRTWERGPDNPIEMYDATDDALNRTTVFRDLIWITAFNQDQLLVFDPSCDKVVGENIALDRSDLLAGPFGTVFFRDTVDVGYFILSNANALGRMEITTDDDG